MNSYIRNRFYFRGATPLGILNTILDWLINRVVVLHIAHTGKIVKVSIGKGTDHPPRE